MSTGTVLSIVGGMAWLAGFVTCFVLALKSKKLPKYGIILGATTFWCGCGTMAFLGIAWNAMQKGIFADVSAGLDPMDARRSLGNFKKGAFACVLGLVLLIIGSQMMSSEQAETRRRDGLGQY